MTNADNEQDMYVYCKLWEKKNPKNYQLIGQNKYVYRVGKTVIIIYLKEMLR